MADIGFRVTLTDPIRCTAREQESATGRGWGAVYTGIFGYGPGRPGVWFSDGENVYWVGENPNPGPVEVEMVIRQLVRDVEAGKTRNHLELLMAALDG